MGEYTIDLTTENFDSKIKKGKWFVDFWAAWCGPCKIIGPLFDAAAKEMHGKVNFGKVDADKESDLAERYEVMSIPTLIFFKDGEVADIVNGVISKDEIIKKSKEI